MLVSLSELESYGSAWGASCVAWGRADLNFTYKPCTRCHTEGEVLAPGPYSVAATAAGHKIVQGFVEVMAGQSVAVHLTLEPLE